MTAESSLLLEEESSKIVPNPTSPEVPPWSKNDNNKKRQQKTTTFDHAEPRVRECFTSLFLASTRQTCSLICHNMGSLCPITIIFIIKIDRSWLFWSTDKSRVSRIVIISCPPNPVILWLLRALSSNPHYIVLFPVLLHTSVFFALHLLTVIVRVYFIRIGK